MTDNNVIDFPRIGFNLTPATTAGPVIPPSATTPDNTTPGGGRRSPLDLLAALPDPGIRQPVIPTQTLQPQPGQVPDTFRSEPSADLIGPRIGALSLAAILAVAVAALRGAHTVASTWWEQRQARLAEGDPLRQARLQHQLAMQGIHDKAAQQRAKKIPSSSEFGRKTLGGGGRSSGGRSGGSGSNGGRGSSGRSGSRSGGLLPGSGSGRKNGSKTNQGGSSGRSKTKGGLSGGDSRSRKNHGQQGAGGGRGNGSTHRGPKQKSPKAPHRTSQGGGAGLKKASGKQTPTRSKNTPGKGNGGRTTLPQALKKDTHKAAKRRLNRRRKHDKPALWTDASRKNKHTPKKDNAKKPNTGKTTTHTPDQEMWRKLKQAAASRWKKRRKTGQATPPSTPTTGKQKQKTTGADWWAKARAYAHKHGVKNGQAGSRHGPTTGAGPTPGTGQTRGTRRSPFENAAQAGTTPTWTVERDDYPGAQAKTWQPAALTTGPAALDTSPTPHAARPGTTRPKEPIAMPPAPVPARPDPRITKARHQAARAANTMVSRHMDAQHETEITLDDALDEYGDFKDDAFKTSDQCSKLSVRARKLRDTLALFAEDLAVNHNLIGPLFSGAMARMAESMDLVARMADEMEISSLQAAEMSETADNDLNDAYRPYTQATADAGLTTPSAPIHNQT